MEELRTDKHAPSGTPSDTKGGTEPSVYQFTDFKEYLKAFYNYKKRTKSGFSYSSFSLKARITSKNYLKRIIDGERPLSPEFVPKVCRGLGLEIDEAQYFEALVNFCQAKDDDSKGYYFQVLQRLGNEKTGSAIELLGAQANVLKHWFIYPLMELIKLRDFEEKPSFIVKKLKGKVTEEDVKFGLSVLETAGLVERNSETGRLNVVHDLVRYSEDIVNLTVRAFHKEMLDRSKDAFTEDEFGTWNARALTIAVPQSKYQEIHQAVSDFVYSINKKYSFENPKELDLVLQLNCQLFQVSEINPKPKYQKNKEKKRS